MDTVTESVIEHRLTELLASFGMDAQTRDMLHRAGTIRTLCKGQMLFVEGDIAHRVGILVTGALKLVRTSADGEESIARLIVAGEWYGLVSLLESRRSYPATAVAVIPTTVIEWSTEAFIEMLTRNGTLSLGLIRQLIQVVHALQERLHDVATQDVSHRIARAVIQLMSQTGRRTPGGIEIGLPLRRADIAELAGTTIYTVSRVLRHWQRCGWLRIGRTKLTVCNPAALFHSIGEQPPPTFIIAPSQR